MRAGVIGFLAGLLIGGVAWAQSIPQPFPPTSSLGDTSVVGTLGVSGTTTLADLTVTGSTSLVGALDGGSAGGTYLGLNADAAFAGDLIHLQFDGNTRLKVNDIELVVDTITAEINGILITNGAIASRADDDVALVIRGFSPGQSANLLEIQDSDLNVLLLFGVNGELQISGDLFLPSGVIVVPDADPGNAGQFLQIRAGNATGAGDFDGGALFLDAGAKANNGVDGRLTIGSVVALPAAGGAVAPKVLCIDAAGVVYRSATALDCS